MIRRRLLPHDMLSQIRDKKKSGKRKGDKNSSLLDMKMIIHSKDRHTNLPLELSLNYFFLNINIELVLSFTTSSSSLSRS